MAQKAKEVEAPAQKGVSRVVGIDVANSTIKAWTDEADMVYRNTVKEINDAGLVYSFKTDYQMYVFDNSVYEVGDMNAMGSGGRGSARYNSKHFKTETIIGITALLQKAKATPGENLRVVTGVPSVLAKNNKVINDLKISLLGEYNVKSVTWNSVEDVVFTISEVIIVPQPLGTLYDYVFDEKEKKLDQKLLEQRAVVVDIGWGTTDIAVLEGGRVRSTFGFEIGTSDFISGLQEEVNTEIPDANIFALQAHELDLKLLESNIVETPFGQYDLTSFVEKQKKLQAQRIRDEVMSLGLEFNKFYRIIFTGGGSLLYEKYIREEFNDPRLLIHRNAVRANSRGFWLLGKY